MALTDIDGGRLADNAFSLGKNKLINGNFDVWQRGTTFTTTVSGTSDYTADRWKAGGGTSTTVSRQAFTLGQTDVPGEPTYYAQWAITNNSQNYEFQQRIEDVRTLAGQQATISFYARRTTGSITVGLRTVQYFGTGGSPSSSVVVSAGTPSLTTSWQKFTYTVSIGSVSGKTLGSNNDHSLWVGFQVSDTNTGTIEIAQFQVEQGAAATPFEHRSYADELQNCKRYFQAVGTVCSGFIEGTTFVAIATAFHPEMRTTPSISVFAGKTARFRDNAVDLTIATPTLNNTSTNRWGVWTRVSTSGRTNGNPITGRVNGSDGDFIAASAEL